MTRDPRLISSVRQSKSKIVITETELTIEFKLEMNADYRRL